jgi:hypothetical protein
MKLHLKDNRKMLTDYKKTNGFIPFLNEIGCVKLFDFKFPNDSRLGSVWEIVDFKAFRTLWDRDPWRLSWSVGVVKDDELAEYEKLKV